MERQQLQASDIITLDYNLNVMTDFSDINFDTTDRSQKRRWPFGIDEPQSSVDNSSSPPTTEPAEGLHLLGSVSNCMHTLGTIDCSLLLDHQRKSTAAIFKRQSFTS
jgi:hypothetical protein